MNILFRQKGQLKSVYQNNILFNKFISRSFTKKKQISEHVREDFWSVIKKENERNNYIKLNLNQIKKLNNPSDFINRWSKAYRVDCNLEKAEKEGRIVYKYILKRKDNVLVPGFEQSSFIIEGKPKIDYKLAQKEALMEFMRLIKDKQLYNVQNNSKSLLLFLNKFKQAILNKNKKLVESLIKGYNKPLGVLEFNYFYRTLLFSLDLNFASEVAQLINDKIEVFQSDFISHDEYKYFKHHRFLLFLEIMEDIIQSLKNTNNTCVSLVYNNKLQGNDYHMLKFDDERNANNFKRRLLVPDTKIKFERTFDEICKQDYVIIEDESNMYLAEVISISTDYTLKVQCLNEIPPNAKVKMTKLTTSISIDVFESKLLNFCTKKNSCNENLRKCITGFKNDPEGLRKAAEEKIINFPEGFQMTESNLTESQKSAIENAVTNRLTLIQGPPGTGKTKTSAEIVKNWLKLDPSTPILVSADSNIAVDNICGELAKSKIKYLRVGQNSNEMEYFKISNPLAKYVAIKNNASSIQVVCTTTVSLSSKMLDNFKFKRVIIDEAAQSTEVSNICTLAKQAEQLVIIGDHKQLPPTIISKIAEEHGYSISLFERLANAGIKPYLLNVQFRMHPYICEFPSKYFYDNQLTTGISKDDRPMINGFNWPNPEVPVAFINIKSQEHKNFKSYYNEKEAEEIYSVVNSINSSNTVKPKGIGIITPYDAQKRLLKNKFNIIRYNKYNLEIDTVDGFQGREKELIIFSAVRSNRMNNIGFLQDMRRLNVMLTRARTGLIVFGCKETLYSNVHWKKWIDWCHAKKVIIDHY